MRVVLVARALFPHSPQTSAIVLLTVTLSLVADSWSRQKVRPDIREHDRHRGERNRAGEALMRTLPHRSGLPPA